LQDFCLSRRQFDPVFAVKSPKGEKRAVKFFNAGTNARGLYAADTQRSASLRRRIEAQNGTHILAHAEALGLGVQQYELIMTE
jgi:uncharacterized Fe-S center protein